MKKKFIASAGIILLACLILSAGCVSTSTSLTSSNPISLESAQNAALHHAGLTASQVTFTKGALDYENGLRVYEIKFVTDSAEYEYDINAANGDVVKYSKETFPSYTSTAFPTVMPTLSGKYISVDEAKKIALAKANLNEADIRSFKCEFKSFDDDYSGKAVYDIEFKSGLMEYDVDVDATTGAVLKYKEK